MLRSPLQQEAELRQGATLVGGDYDARLESSAETIGDGMALGGTCQYTPTRPNLRERAYCTFRGSSDLAEPPTAGGHLATCIFLLSKGACIVSTAVLDQDQICLRPTYPTLAEFIRKHAIQQGSFVLASSVASDYYCDGKQVSFSGQGLSLVVEAILDDLKDLEFDAIGGMDMGATPIVSALALKYFQLGRDVPAFVVRKDVKPHGTMKRIEGPIPDPPCRVVVIDDVVTSGGSILQAIQAVRDRGPGYEVVRAISMLDREEGGAKRLQDDGISYRPLVTTSQLGITSGARQASSRDCTE